MTDVLAFDSSRGRNAQAIADAARLGWLPEPVLDASYGRGNFWLDYKPEQLVTNDLYVAGVDHAVDFTDRQAMSELGEFSTVVVDPPYRLHGKPDRDDRDERYGLQVERSSHERMRDLVLATIACCSVSTQVVLVKCQDQVCSGYVHRQSLAVRGAAKPMGFRWVDQLYVVNSAPPQRSQRHARQNVSVLMCLRKSNPKLWS